MMYVEYECAWYDLCPWKEFKFYSYGHVYGFVWGYVLRVSHIVSTVFSDSCFLEISHEKHKKKKQLSLLGLFTKLWFKIFKIPFLWLILKKFQLLWFVLKKIPNLWFGLTDQNFWLFFRGHFACGRGEMAPYATLGHFAYPTGEMAKPCQGISPVGQAKCLDRTEPTRS